MSRENVETVRAVVVAYARGDYRTAIDALHPDVELWVDRRAYPDAGFFRGRDAVVSWYSEFVSTFDRYWAEPPELIDAGDWVVSLGRAGGRGRLSGAPVDQLWTTAQKLHAGKIVRIEFHPDLEKAMQAARGAPPS